MAYLKSLGTFFIYLGAFLTAIAFIPGLPPHAKFAEYSFAAPKELTNELASNDRLNNPEKLFKDQIMGPEAFDSYNGELYTGLKGGYIVKVSGNKLMPVVKLGKDCDGLWQEPKCGRPLGLKFDKKGALYVTDSYYGIYKVDVKTGKYEIVVDSKKPIEGKPPMIVNSLDIASNGDIYWSDSSTEFILQDGFYTLLSNPSGRLIRFNAATKQNQVLVHNLGFANGVALSKEEDFVIVLETALSRITKYYIKGQNAGKREIFAESLPGAPDNVHSDGKGGYLVSLFTQVNPKHPMFTQVLASHPYMRRMLSRLLALLELPFQYLQSYYPNYYAEVALNYIGSFESMSFSLSKVAILRIDGSGKIIDAAYNTDEKLSSLSSGFIHNGYLWLGSPHRDYIARIPLEKAFPSLAIEKTKKQYHQTESTGKSEQKNIPKQTEKPAQKNIPKQTEPKSDSQTPKPSESKPTNKADKNGSLNEKKTSHSKKSSTEK